MKDEMNLTQVAGVTMNNSLTRLMVVDDDQGVLEIMALFLKNSLRHRSALFPIRARSATRLRRRPGRL